MVTRTDLGTAGGAVASTCLAARTDLKSLRVFTPAKISTVSGSTTFWYAAARPATSSLRARPRNSRNNKVIADAAGARGESDAPEGFRAAYNDQAGSLELRDWSWECVRPSMFSQAGIPSVLQTTSQLPSSLDVAVHAVLQLEDDRSSTRATGPYSCATASTSSRPRSWSHRGAPIAASAPPACAACATHPARPPLVEPSYFFTQKRWDEHVTALEREKASGGRARDLVSDRVPAAGHGGEGFPLPNRDSGRRDVRLGRHAVRATSTGGLTNKLTGRIGDTPVPEPGFRLRSGRSAAIDSAKEVLQS
ncbi:hypothetical protein GGTG_14158 [Gaeumannomyces tritici R3-111a-1]|uniref:Uncharacterized protein n=1 Tax=Gaeumannomyces tritici (strain R3-111a-1) TaxID=644352 RepID=J3PKU0_GAET3|nr:hypothetical protein GGTG_14158 [Gaeumannomyces tritici R3-111a-1]EJT68262.1 hypothetical protein GGTG_14158 [Gaeumannomyces tritici R3-111a-1]